MLYCVLVVYYPGVLILRFCAIVIWSFVGVAIGKGIAFGWHLLPIYLFWYSHVHRLWFVLLVLVLFVERGVA